MILVGQYDSPFVRRVGITLTFYGLRFEHRPWSVWGDAERLGELNPLRRVPTLILEDQSVLVESFAIVDALDDRVGEARALLPRSGARRQEGLRLTSLASGVADKAVSLLYESLFRSQPSELWTQRCRTQIEQTLDRLERDLLEAGTDYFLGDSLSHPDIMSTCAWRFGSEAHASLFVAARWPTLAALAARCEQLPVFQAVYQPIVNNLSNG